MSLRTRIEFYVVAAFLLYAVVVRIAYDNKENARQAEAEKTAVAALKGKGFVQGIVKSQAALLAEVPKKLADAVREIQKSDPKVAPVEHVATTVAVKDTAKGETTSEGGHMTSVCDEYGRFCFDLTGAVPLLNRSQLFRVDTLVVKRIGGKYELAKSEFSELNPKTKELIPLTGVTTDVHFSIEEEQAQAAKPGLFHPILVVGADLAGVGAGVEFFRLDRFTLTALGLYDRSAKTVRGSLQLGYRLKFPFLDTNLVAGVSYSTDQRIRPSGSVQVTR